MDFQILFLSILFSNHPHFLFFLFFPDHKNF